MSNFLLNFSRVFCQFWQLIRNQFIINLLTLVTNIYIYLSSYLYFLSYLRSISKNIMGSILILVCFTFLKNETNLHVEVPRTHTLVSFSKSDGEIIILICFTLLNNKIDLHVEVSKHTLVSFSKVFPHDQLSALSVTLGGLITLYM